MNTDRKLPPLNRNDIVIRFFSRLKLEPFGVFFLVSIFNIATNIFLASYFNVINATAVSVGLSREPGAWALDFIAQPLVVAIYIWLNKISEKLLLGLLANEKVRLGEQSISIFTKHSRKINSQWLSWGSIIIGTFTAIAVTIFLVNDPNNSTWIKQHIFLMYWRTLVAIPIYIIIYLVLGYIVLFIKTFNSIIRTYGVHVEPFHPDNAGGLGAIGHFSSNLGYIIFGFGLVLCLLVYQAYINLAENSHGWITGAILYLIVYLIMAPLCFFLPLITVHKAMVEYKTKILENISREINACLGYLYDKNDDTSQVELGLKKIRQLEEMRELALRYPVWPYNQQNLRKYIGLAVAPIGPFIISVITDLVKSYISIF